MRGNLRLSVACVRTPNRRPVNYTRRTVIVVVWARVPAWSPCETSVNVTFWFGVAPTNLFAVDQEQVRAVDAAVVAPAERAVGIVVVRQQVHAHGRPLGLRT